MNVIAGDATIEQMFNKALVWNAADFYELTSEHLLTLDGWKEKSAERFLNSLSESRKVPFERVLYALGIRHVGEATAKAVARHFRNIDRIMEASEEDLLKLLLQIQDTAPEKQFAGCWRGMYDLSTGSWGGGDRYEGGAASIYTGWTNAPISLAICFALRGEALTDLL